MNVLSIRGLSKSFGQQKIINDLNMSVPEGSVFGFIGQNGAGKTTTMKMVLGLLQSDQGEILVCNEPVHYGQTKTNQYIGYLPDVPEFYSYMTAMQYLTLCGGIVGLSKESISQKRQKLLFLVGLDGVEKRIGGYSRGMKQRLGIAQALLTDPKLLICDEPTSALDPVGRKEILDILYKIRGTTTVLFSTHILSDVERICDHVALLNGGNIAVGGTLSEIKALHSHDSLLIEFSNRDDLWQFKVHLAEQTLLNEAEEKGREIIIHSREMKKVQLIILTTLAEADITPVKLELMEPSLESLFLEVIKCFLPFFQSLSFC